MSECKNTEGPRVFLPDLERALRGPIEGVFSDIDEEDGCAIALRDGAVRIYEPVLAALRRENEALREALEATYGLAREGCHHSDGSCDYDDYGHGASGMAQKPCSKYRKGHPERWCYACKLEATGARAALEATKEKP